MFSRSSKRTVAALALLAMLVVQLSGGIYHYYCDCTGKAVVTLDEHCHGEQGVLGPIDHAPVGHQHHDDDHDDVPADTSGSHHHHELVQTPTDTVPPDVVMAPAVSLTAVLWIEIFETTLASTMEPCLVIQPPPDDGGPPPMPLLVVRSVVFLI